MNRFVLSTPLRDGIRAAGLNKTDVQRLTGSPSYRQVFDVLAGKTFGDTTRERFELLAVSLGLQPDAATVPYRAKNRARR